MANEPQPAEAPIVGTSMVTTIGNGNGKTKEIIIRWIGGALLIVLLGIVSLSLSALWKPPQDWSIVDKALGYLNTLALTMGTTLAALARPNGN